MTTEEIIKLLQFITGKEIYIRNKRKKRKQILVLGIGQQKNSNRQTTIATAIYASLTAVTHRIPTEWNVSLARCIT